MSASVIRRGLELFNEKDKVKRKQKKSSSRRSALMEQISSEKQGVQRRIRQLQRPGASTRSTNTVKDKHIRSALDEYRKKQKKSQLQSNLQYFLGAERNVQSQKTRKIVEQHSGRRACLRPDPTVSKPQQNSVFTEKDFQKFQKEYFSNL
ncbi:ribosomal protein S19 binding protein 1 [Puntigrus tetrazona]|uniref:ribosomal protein S19 binding protein 1 n=1 Tax=Puntigrus tetrazona TaxID=1606681 RepID=UPI001C89601E|nr:ribosomal protein S19 binding protein 1 [Puntigrus tetrazona]